MKKSKFEWKTYEKDFSSFLNKNQLNKTHTTKFKQKKIS